MQRSTQIWLGSLGVLVLLQLIPLDRSNPPVEREVPASQEVRQVLRRGCYDCHSNETRWPWYSHVAPISFLIYHDVHEARHHVNFSTWNRYDAKKRKKKFDNIGEEVEDGDMPLWYYVPLHPKADLDKADRALLMAWSKQH